VAPPQAHWLPPAEPPDRFGPPVETAYSRELRRRIEAGRRRVAISFFVYRWASSITCTAVLLIAPNDSATTLPPLNNKSVGMLWIL